jgi:2-polyprenyl-6-methoxyphenol hydroxylase-like FAD-dependent oxidoreductase
MPLSTIVVGGGIGGLSLARQLTLVGLPVVVLERAPKLATVGAGIIMNPNAMSVLEANGLAPCVRSGSAPYLARETFDHRGRPLATRDYRPLYADGRLAVGALLHRAHLQECLHDGVPAKTVRLDARIVALDADPEGVRIEIDGGEVFTGDVLVGADGIRSSVRARFFGPTEPMYLGYRSHRFVVPNHDGESASFRSAAASSTCGRLSTRRGRAGRGRSRARPRCGLSSPTSATPEYAAGLRR